MPTQACTAPPPGSVPDWSWAKNCTKMSFSWRSAAVPPYCTNGSFVQLRKLTTQTWICAIMQLLRELKLFIQIFLKNNLTKEPSPGPKLGPKINKTLKKITQKRRELGSHLTDPTLWLPYTENAPTQPDLASFCSEC